MGVFDSDDIEDLFNKASADIDEWLNEGMAEFQKGPVNRTADKVWRSQPEAIKNAAREQVPEAAATLDGLRPGGNNANITG